MPELSEWRNAPRVAPGGLGSPAFPPYARGAHAAGRDAVTTLGEEKPMPFYEKGEIRIHYEEVGPGFPLLVIPGAG
jgi:hypothetical protein